MGQDLDSGWIKLHRKIKKSEIWGNPDLVYFWVWCLTSATREPYSVKINGKKVNLKPGQFIFGQRAAARETGLSAASCYRYIQKLKSNRMLNLKVNRNYTLATIVNWGIYQGNVKKAESQSESQIESKLNTNKKYIGEAENPPQKSAELCEEEKDGFVNEDGSFNWDAVEDEE